MNKKTSLTTACKPKALQSMVRKAVVGSILFAGVFAAPATLARWFEVEVILFSRTQDPTQLDEDFEASRASKLKANQLDLFASFLLAPNDCPQPEPIPLASLANDALAQLALPPSEEEIDILGEAEAALVLTEQSAADAIEQGVEYDEFGFPIANVEPEPDPELEEQIVLDELEPERTPEEQLAFEQWLSDCQKPQSYDELSQLPVTMTPHQIPLTDSSPYLLSADLLQLTDARQRLANGGAYKPMLHAGWRINIESKRRMAALKLVAGQNFGERYSSDGWEHPIEAPALEDAMLNDDEPVAYGIANQQTENTVQAANGALPLEPEPTETPALSATEFTDSATLPAVQLPSAWQELDITAEPKEYKPAVWELEANLHIWLANWLHIETDMVLRRSGRKSPQEVNQPPEQLALAIEPTSTLISDAATVPYLFKYQLAQFRRVRSLEIHYFDHPMMGMIVQIRPYDVRPAPEPTEATDSDAPLANSPTDK